MRGEIKYITFRQKEKKGWVLPAVHRSKDAVLDRFEYKLRLGFWRIMLQKVKLKLNDSRVKKVEQ